MVWKRGPRGGPEASGKCGVGCVHALLRAWGGGPVLRKHLNAFSMWLHNDAKPENPEIKQADPRTVL